MASSQREKLPWFPFYPTDWQGDEQLSMCSLGARGLLIELLCVMHRAKPYGHLLVNEKQPTDAELARMVRANSAPEVRRLRTELLERGVLSQTEDGTLFSRRMERDAIKLAMDRENGKKGGNPNLKRAHGVTEPITDRLSGGLTQSLTGADKAQKPEARSERPETRNQSQESSTANGKKWRFPNLYVSPAMHKVVADFVGKAGAGIDWDGFYNAAACDYNEQGPPADALADLKQRARKAAQARREPDHSDTLAKIKAEEAAYVPMTDEQKAEAKAKMRRALSTR